MSEPSPAPPASSAPAPPTADDVRTPLRAYRTMATIVGVLLVVLILVGTPLANFDGTGMWYVIPATPDIWAPGSQPQQIGEAITEYLGVAHGWLYMIFLFCAFWLSRRAQWEIPFTIVTLLCGTVPLLSFWAEHRATARVRAEVPGVAAPTSV